MRAAQRYAECRNDLGHLYLRVAGTHLGRSVTGMTAHNGAREFMRNRREHRN